MVNPHQFSHIEANPVLQSSAIGQNRHRNDFWASATDLFLPFRCLYALSLRIVNNKEETSHLFHLIPRKKGDEKNGNCFVNRSQLSSSELDCYVFKYRYHPNFQQDPSSNLRKFRSAPTAFCRPLRLASD